MPIAVKQASKLTSINPKASPKKATQPNLTETQKELLWIIAEKGGKISQKELCTITGYTKTKISRNLISLEQQVLVTKEKWGRNFRVYITETGRKVIE